MRKRSFISLVLLMFFAFGSVAFADEKKLQANNDKKFSNKLFSVTMPQSVSGTYTVKKRKNGIYIYDKVSKKAGFGGFAFGIRAYKEPSEYAMMPGGRKIGELQAKKRELYDIVLIQPTDVQFDYVHDNKKTYMPLYQLAENIHQKIEGKNENIYCDKQGTLGEEMYGEIIKKHITAIKEKWTSEKLEKENMSYMYNVLAQTNKNVLDKVGYAFYDANGDGIEELVIGEIADGEWKGVVYDIYTMVNREPAHVVSGGTRNRYFVCDEVFICNEYSSGALESGMRVYDIVANSNELFPQVGFKYDGYANPKNPWFLSYNFANDEWDNVSEQKYNERKKTFAKYVRFDYIPLSKYRKGEN